MTYPFLTDRTSIETDWTCPRKRWWMLHEGGQGIVPASMPDALRDGIAVHEALASLLSGTPLSLPPMPTEPETTQKQLEAWARQVGWLVAFTEWVVPEWITPFYDIVAVEQEMVLERPEIWVAFTADVILRQKAEPKKLVVWDFKSVGWLTKEWAESWPFAVQVHVNLIGVEEELNEPVSHGLIVGLSKGSEREGKLRHPYVWAYSDGTQWSSEWKKGWALRPTWEYGSGGAEGVREWVLSLGREAGLAQFPLSMPIVADRGLVEELIEARIQREFDVREALELVNDDDPELARSIFSTTFPQHFKSCRPAVGAGCDYLHACHNAEIGADPLGSGLFKVRIPHHEIELPND